MSDKKNSRETDLAWIIHGVVIANGFMCITDAIKKDLSHLIALLLLLIVSILDWHLFYKVDDFISQKQGNYYTPDLWIGDYIILACYAILFKLVSSEQIYFFQKLISSTSILSLIFISIIAVFSSYWWITMVTEFSTTSAKVCVDILQGVLFYTFIPLIVYLALKGKILIAIGVFILDIFIYVRLIKRTSVTFQ